MSTFPHIPPTHPLDEPPPEQLILFLEAVARVTPAFVELRDEVLPKWIERPLTRGAVDSADQWRVKWNLNKWPNDRLQGWIYDVLDHWTSHPDAAKELAIDQGWRSIAPLGRNTITRREVVARFEIHAYDCDLESLDSYGARLHTAIDEVVAKEREKYESLKARYTLQSRARRERGYPPHRPYEWLALHICLERSDGYIAKDKKHNPERVSRDVIKKARQRLSAELQMGT